MVLGPKPFLLELVGGITTALFLEPSFPVALLRMKILFCLCLLPSFFFMFRGKD